MGEMLWSIIDTSIKLFIKSRRKKAKETLWPLLMSCPRPLGPMFFYRLTGFHLHPRALPMGFLWSLKPRLPTRVAHCDAGSGDPKVLD